MPSPGPPRYTAVDIGGTKIHAATGDLQGRIDAEARIDTAGERGPDDALRRTAELIARLDGQTGRTAAVGIGLPGLVDESGIARFLPNLPGHWTGVAVTETIARLTGRPAYCLNDARMATLGEFVFGAGRESRRMLLITLGTGIGGGLVLDGRLQRGIFGGAGEVGHQTIYPDGPLCTCGNPGCLEVLASGPALIAAARQAIGRGEVPGLEAHALANTLTPAHIAEAAEQGNPACRQILQTAGECLGIGMANAVTITAVDTIVVTGGLAALSKWLLPPARATLVQRVRMFPADGVRVFPSQLDGRAALLGAIALAAQHPALSSTDS